MSVFREPSDYPWAAIILIYLMSFGFAAYWLRDDLTPHAWAVPSANELTLVHGHFASSKAGIKAPYLFTTDSGQHLEFGCLPESGMADCLEAARIDLRSLANQPAQVEYFDVPNSKAPSLSNVLMTLSVNGEILLGFGNREQELRQWSLREEQIKQSVLTLGYDALVPLALFLFALWLTVAKWKRPTLLDA